MTRPNAHPAPQNAASWEALLAGWTEFARASLALPKTEEGSRWREAVPSIISLSALAHALDQAHTLAPDERGSGLATAGAKLKMDIRALHELWQAEPLPDEIGLLIQEARDAMSQAESIGFEWVVTSDTLIIIHPGDAQAMLVAAGFEGDLYVPTPGVPLFEGSPAAFVSADADDDILELVHTLLHRGEGEVEGPIEAPARQAYRQFDFGKGGPVRDLVRPMSADPIAGQPLLVPAILAGEMQPVTLPVPGADRVDPLPVEFDESAD